MQNEPQNSGTYPEHKLWFWEGEVKIPPPFSWLVRQSWKAQLEPAPKTLFPALLSLGGICNQREPCSASSIYLLNLRPLQPDSEINVGGKNGRTHD